MQHTRRRSGLRFGAAVLVTGALALASLNGPAAGSATVGSAGAAPAVNLPDPVPEVSKSGPSDSLLRALAALPRAEAEAAIRGQGIAANDAGTKVLVEVVAADGVPATRAAVEAVGGRITGGVDGYLVEAYVPLDRVTELERDARVKQVSVPGNVALAEENTPTYQPASPNAIGGPQQHVQKINSTPWRQAGFNGAGVKVGIIDSFSSQTWSAVAGAGSLPAQPAGTFCRIKGQVCNVWNPQLGDRHGVAVAETIHDIAPAAQLYLAFALTPADLQAAVNYFDAQGVRIISRSQGAIYDGPGNGQGAVDAVVNSAVTKGMMWVNSAGNSAGGHYWRGAWSSPDGDAWLDFRPGQELLAFSCGLPLGVRWSDWGAAASRTDYDVYVFEDLASVPQAKFTAAANQQTGAAPIEYLDYDHGFQTCDNNDYEFLAVLRYDGGAGTAGDQLEFMVNNGFSFRDATGAGLFTNPFSATQPASDSANPGALSIGAIDPPLGFNIASYSSRGPTNDNRIKPDLSAASNFRSAAYAGQGGTFNGTSAATPVVSGAAALVLQSKPSHTPASLATWLKTIARVERGPVGPDNTYGRGELRLPAPPGATTPTKPGRPGRIKVIKEKRSKAKIKWGAADRASSYAVYVRKASARRWRGITNVHGRKVWLTGLQRDKKYVVGVTALSNGQYGEYRYKKFTFRKKVPRL